MEHNDIKHDVRSFLFDKYALYITEDEKIVGVNEKAFELADEAYDLFKRLYDIHYGEIIEDENLIVIHTGGWSDNEELIRELKRTGWWIKYHKITATGGHYYFDTDFHSKKKWKIIVEK